MAKSYLEIQTQIGKLQAEADALRRKEVSEVVGRIQEAIRHYGLTIEDLGLKHARAPYGSKKAGKRAGGSKAASGTKYKDGQGNTWGGRGPRPAWLREALAQGRSFEEFAAGAAAPKAAATAPSRAKAGAKALPRAKKAAPTTARGGKGRTPRRTKAATEAQAQRPDGAADASAEAAA